MEEMLRNCMFILILFSMQAAAGDFLVTASTTSDCPIGHLAKMRFEIQNLSDEPLVLLEIDPAQPCEDSISFVRLLYGRIRFDEQCDEYVHEILPQSETQIPVMDGLIMAGEKKELDVDYRPFAKTEQFTLRFARAAGMKIYRKVGVGGEEGEQYYSPEGTVTHQVIFPGLVSSPKGSEIVAVVLDGVFGTEVSHCYCVTLGESVDTGPFSMFKEWDLGQVVEFRVGEKQEGMGPDRASAGWKFLDEFEVIFGDGMYTHGEFVQISPEQARVFWGKIKGKFSIKRIEYFFTAHYYDLEPLFE